MFVTIPPVVLRFLLGGRWIGHYQEHIFCHDISSWERTSVIRLCECARPAMACSQRKVASCHRVQRFILAPGYLPSARLTATPIARFYHYQQLRAYLWRVCVELRPREECGLPRL